MYTGITNSNALRWYNFWNMMTTTHIPSCMRGKGIFPHRDCITRCSQFPIFNCNPLPIEYLPLQQSLQFLDLPFQQKPSISSPPPHNHVFRRITRRHHHTRYVSESHGTVLPKQQFRLLDGPNPTSGLAHTARPSHLESAPTHPPGTSKSYSPLFLCSHT